MKTKKIYFFSNIPNIKNGKLIGIVLVPHGVTCAVTKGQTTNYADDYEED